MKRLLKKTSLASILFAGVVLAVAVTVEAQQVAKMPHIGFLGVATPASYANQLVGFRQGLGELGYVEGKTITVDFRWAEGKYERLPTLAAELVHLKVEVIVTHGTPATLALKQATKTIPIVMATSGDAVRSGLVDSLARPGGNVTGQSYLGPELAAKRLELIREAVPSAGRMAFVQNPANPYSKLAYELTEHTAQKLKMDLQRFDVTGPGEFAHAFAAMAKAAIDVVAIDGDAMLTANAAAIAELAIKHRLPAIAEAPFANAGGMIGYGPDYFEMFRHAAYHVNKLLKGAKPADLPVEQPTKFELVINLKTAKQIGLTIPPNVLARADKVIK
jgi:putative ABC transport system substrate-binding protein